LQRAAHADANDRMIVDDKALWTLVQDRFRYLGFGDGSIVSPGAQCKRS
jgi:hypothetical protein